jgi:AcrR family transcriptional regulator
VATADWRADSEHEAYDAIRARIIAAAWELLTADERSTVRMGEVARRSGYCRATLYRYFSSKDELIGAAYVSVVEPLAGAFRDQICRYDDPAKQLVEGLLAVVRYVRGHSNVAGEFLPGPHTERMRGLSEAARGEIARALVRPLLEVLPLSFANEREERRVAHWLRALILSLVAGGLSELGSEQEERVLLHRFVVPSLGLESAG